MGFKLFDVVITLFVILIISIFSIKTITTNNSNSYVRITVEGESYIYPLDIDRELEFYGSLGIVKVQIINKEVAIIDSTCRNHICVDAGFISKIGQSTACLPNRILVSIESSKMEDVDVGAY